MTIASSLRTVGRWIGVIALVLLLARCSSTAPPAATETASDTTAAPTGPPLTLVYTDAAGLHLEEVRTQTTTLLQADVRFAGARAVSPSGRYVALSYTADSTHLGLLDLQTQTLQPLHAKASNAVYSLSWHPTNDTLAFGVYTPTEEGKRGPGTIRWATPDGIHRSVGCRAAREVLSWTPEGHLATRDNSNLYVVATDDCATQASLDIRKKHHLTYSTDGSTLAYILRDLEYDRSAGEYVPDSTLYVSDTRGDDAQALFGDARRARHLQWAPHGAKLAFDVRSEDDVRRHVVVYNADADRTSYVVPPAATVTADQVDPRWSPDGVRVAFTRQRASGMTAVVRVKGQTRSLGATTGPVWGWADDQHVVVPGPDAWRITTLGGQTVHTLPRTVALVYVRMEAVRL